jgi:hypothetical protein
MERAVQSCFRQRLPSLSPATSAAAQWFDPQAVAIKRDGYFGCQLKSVYINSFYSTTISSLHQLLVKGLTKDLLNGEAVFVSSSLQLAVGSHTESPLNGVWFGGSGGAAGTLW